MTETDDTLLGRAWHGRAILHVDMDAFFAAVEQLDHPEWRGRPVIVGGDADRRGVVAAASYEARRFGVRSAMPSARAKALCPDAIWAPGRFDRYREISRAIRSVFADESPLVQPVSIDEAYLDVSTGTHGRDHPIAVARRIQGRVDELGITCSIGVATSKSVAKIASDMDKPHGLTVVWPGDERTFLDPLPVGSLQGIGPKTAERLMHLGIATLGDLARVDHGTAETLLGAHGPTLVERARGVDPRPVHENDPAKSVSNERTFAADVREAGELNEALEALATRVGSRLRHAGLAGRTVTLKVRFSDFSTRTVRRTLPEPSDDEAVFGAVARELLAQAWAPGVGVRLIGVGMSGFQAKAVQLDLWSDGPGAPVPGAASPTPAARSSKRSELVRSVDAVKKRFGENSLRFGKELRNRHRAGGADSEPRTPAASSSSDDQTYLDDTEELQ